MARTVPSVASEVWFRNPERWTASLAFLNVARIVWHHGLTLKRRIDPVAHARLSFPGSVEWRVMSVAAWGGMEWTPASADSDHPVACYPVWQYGLEPFETLEALCAENVANSSSARHDPFSHVKFRPQPGQEHRVIIGSYPHLSSGPGRRLLVLLGELQQDYPDTIIHLFSATGIASIVSPGLRAGDFDPYGVTSGGRALLPNGRYVSRDKFNAHRTWIKLIDNTTPDQLGTHKALLEFNIKSALYCAEHWQDTFRFRGRARADFAGFTDETPLGELPEPRSRRHAAYEGKPQPGDKIACDHCTLANSCKHYRERSVCNLTQSDTAGLAHFFKTRDADRIIDGLGELLAVQSRRAESALEIEQEGDKLDPELTRILTSMFDAGVKLAKLANPALAAASAPKIAIQVNNGHRIEAASPSALMAGLVKELEAKGIERHEITPEMVVGLLEPPKGEVIDVA